MEMEKMEQLAKELQEAQQEAQQAPQEAPTETAPQEETAPQAPQEETAPTDTEKEKIKANNKAMAEKFKAEQKKAKKEKELKAKKEQKTQKTQQAPKVPKAPKNKSAIQPNQPTQDNIKMAQEAIRKHFYNTGGTVWEISPNLADIQHNKAEGIQEIWGMAKSAGILGKDNKIISYREQEAHKANGEIKIIQFYPLGHSEINYLIYLIPNKDMDIQILEGIKYPFTKKMARDQGKDNREYTFKEITTIQAKQGIGIPLGQVTNNGKSIIYSAKWAQLYKVYFNTKEYKSNGKYTLHNSYQSSTLSLDYGGTLQEIGKNSGQPTGNTLTWLEAFGTTDILNTIPYLQLNG